MNKQKIKNLIQFRKELHRYPELSGKEVETAGRILSFLKENTPDELLTEVGGSGIIAIYKGTTAGKNILFRCELDALPIEEINTFEHRSVSKKVSHKCGHDGHMAIMCGLAMKLAENRPEKGNAILLFQPSEEDGNGAKRVLEDSKFQTIQPDFVFALHNLPGFKKGQIVVIENTFSCAVNSIIIKLKGKTAHAGEPENGINPATAIAAIIEEFQDLIQSDITKKIYCLITPIYIKMGEKAYGVSAGYGEVHFTVRSNSNENMDNIQRKLEIKVQNIAAKNQLRSKIKWKQQFRANENNPEAVAFIKTASETLQLDVSEKEIPFSWGEDFGLFTEHFPGAMFGLGAGTDMPSLHNQDYDFPDEIISDGVSIFHQIFQKINNA